MKTKKISSADKILLFLHKKGNGIFHCQDIRNFVGLKHRQFFDILIRLKRNDFISMESCTTDKRFRNFVLKENGMSRLKKRNVIPFDRESLVEGIKQRHRLSHKRPKRPVRLFVMIPKSVMEIIQHWNKQPHVSKIKVPEETFVGNMYKGPTQSLCDTVSMLRKALVGNNYLSTPIDGISDRIRSFSVQEIKTAIDHFTLAVTSNIHEPRNKDCFKYKASLKQFLYNSYSTSKHLMFRSPFLYFVENEPELLTEQAYLQKLKKDGIEREWLDLVTDKLVEKFTDRFGGERNAMLEAAGVMLYDFAEEHGGIYVSLSHGFDTWPIWLVKALEWRKENSKKEFVVNPFTLMHSWVYTDILISYIKHIQADHTIEFPKIKKGRLIDS